MQWIFGDSGKVRPAGHNPCLHRHPPELCTGATPHLNRLELNADCCCWPWLKLRTLCTLCCRSLVLSAPLPTSSPVQCRAPICTDMWELGCQDCNPSKPMQCKTCLYSDTKVNATGAVSEAGHAGMRAHFSHCLLSGLCALNPAPGSTAHCRSGQRTALQLAQQPLPVVASSPAASARPPAPPCPQCVSVNDCTADPAQGCATCAADNVLSCATCKRAGHIVDASGYVS